LGGVSCQAVDFLLVHLAGIWLQSPWRCFYIQFTFKRNVTNFVLSMRFVKIMLQ
jgi:hypothetical protein